MTNHQELITQLALLRFRAQISYHEHQYTKQAFDLTRAFLERGYLAVHRDGAGELHTDYQGDRLRGYMMIWRQATSWYGAPVQYCALDFDWTDPSAVMWATQKLLELRPLLNDDCELMMSARYSTILGVALGTGFGVDSVILLGDPRLSHQRLIELHNPPTLLAHLNLDIRPIASRREVEHIIRLKRDYFTAHPEYCWFGAHEEHLKHHRAELESAALRSRRPRRDGEEDHPTRLWVIYRERTFLGNFSYTAQSSSPLWGHSAGLDIMLHPLIQQQGVVKTVYRIMLESMIERGVEVYKGGTAQPAVMGLGKQMERPLFSWVLRKHTAFAPDHFSQYLPENLTPFHRPNIT